MSESFSEIELESMSESDDEPSTVAGHLNMLHEVAVDTGNKWEVDFRTWTKVGQAKAVTMLAYKQTNLKIKMGLPVWEGPEYDNINKLIKCMYSNTIELEAELKKATNPAYYLWVTIRPKECELKDLVNFMSVWMKRVYNRGRNFYVYEQKGESIADLGKGKHVHILYKLDGARQSGGGRSTAMNKMNYLKLLKECINGCEIVCPEPHIVTCKFEWGADKKKYVMGGKTDVKKHGAMEMDPIWRVRNHLKAFYNE